VNKMKKKAAFILLLSLFFLITLASPSNAIFDSDLDKAKKFMQAGMYPQAIALLDKRINDKPTDAEAHYQLGICYINTGNHSGADERFGSAVRLKPEYGYKIGGEYKRVGDKHLKNGNIKRAQTLFQKAIQYKPDLRDSIAKEAYSQGEYYFNKAQYDSADRRFSVAIRFDSYLRRPICDMYYQLGQAADENKCVAYYRRTKQYCSSHNKEIGNRLLKISKSKEAKGEIQQWRKEAANFIEVPPDYKIYSPGTYTFSLKAGQKTDHWIMFPAGRENKYNLLAKSYRFQILYDDNTLLNAWEVNKLPKKNRAKFKIIAVVDQQITMTVK